MKQRVNWTNYDNASSLPCRTATKVDSRTVRVAPVDWVLKHNLPVHLRMCLVRSQSHLKHAVLSRKVEHLTVLRIHYITTATHTTVSNGASSPENLRGPAHCEGMGLCPSRVHRGGKCHRNMHCDWTEICWTHQITANRLNRTVPVLCDCEGRGKTDFKK